MPFRVFHFRLPSAALLLAAGALAFSAAARAETVGRVAPDFAALAKQAILTLPPPPAWEASAQVGVWTADDVAAELARITDTPPRVNFLRPQLLRPDHRWLVAFKAWFARVQKPLRIQFKDQVWDCDDFANCFVAFADLLAMQSGEVRGSFCIGWATVNYRRPFAGVRRGAHAVVIVGTSEGLHVLEPQDGTMVPLRDFPNRDTIEEIFL